MASNIVFKQRLHQKGLRATPQRIEVLEALSRVGEASTAEEIYRLCEHGKTNLSTVYRTLGLLCMHGVVLRTLRVDGTAVFYLNGTAHYHQLVCVSCGASVPLHSCPVKVLEKEIGEQTGYLITGHSLELSGICPSCRQKGGRMPE